MKCFKPWEGYFAPFRIFGNLYFVGTQPASTHIIDTGEGLIMLDSGYQHSLYSVIDGIYSVGLDVHDLKFILHTHGHIDHFGATRALIELTGAKTAIGEPDRKNATGESDLSYAKELNMEFTETFVPDILLNDGDTISLGNTTITGLASPGHTAGAMSFFFDVTDGSDTYRAGLHGGAGLNTLRSGYLDKYGLPYSYREQFAHSLDKLAGERVDIFLGNHMQQNNTPEKYKALSAGNDKAFIDKNEWSEFCMKIKASLYKMIENEQ